MNQGSNVFQSTEIGNIKYSNSSPVFTKKDAHNWSYLVKKKF